MRACDVAVRRFIADDNFIAREQAAGFRRVHGLADERSQSEFAPALIEIAHVRVRVGALRDDLHSEIVREHHDRTQDDRAFALVVGAHERLIDLERIEREPLQILE